MLLRSNEMVRVQSGGRGQENDVSESVDVCLRNTCAISTRWSKQTIIFCACLGPYDNCAVWEQRAE